MIRLAAGARRHLTATAPCWLSKFGERARRARPLAAWMVTDGQTETATRGMPHLFRAATELMLADRPLRADGAGSGALLVIAHPDDECMFFTPTVLGLARQGITAHVLCLSTGNFDGLGATRSLELRASCVALGVDERQTKPAPSPNRNRNRNPNPFPRPAAACIASTTRSCRTAQHKRGRLRASLRSCTPTATSTVCALARMP